MHTFTRSKRHNLVEVAINYECVNDRIATTAEIALLLELSRLMVSACELHAHGNTPIVPTIVNATPETYQGHIVLKFPIKTKRPDSNGKPIPYSFAGLHATLQAVRNICNRRRDTFINMSINLNLEAMTAPWVLPVPDKGVILRNEYAKKHYHGKYGTGHTYVNGIAIKLDEMFVAGEPRAVAEFDRRWVRMCNEHHAHNEQTHDPVPYGPALRLDSLRSCWKKVEWQNLCVMTRRRGTNEWVVCTDFYNTETVSYIATVGNDMMQTPMGFDNDDMESTGNIFLNDHSYFEMVDVIA